MSSIKIQSSSSGGGSITLTAPTTSSNRTVTLPDADVTLGAPYDSTGKFPITVWVDYAPQSNTINASGGLGSITDNGVGDQTFNFSSAKPNAYYSYGGCGYDDSLGNSDDGITTAGYATKTSSAIRMISGYRNTEYDYDGFSYFFGIHT